MSESIRKHNGWIAIVMLLAVPPCFVRNIRDDFTVRLVSYFVLALAITAFFSYYLFSRSSLIKGTAFDKQFKEQNKRRSEYVIRNFCAIAAVAGLWMIISVLLPVIDYNTDPSSASVEVHKISHIDSAAIPGAFYIRIGIRTDNGKDLSYWYPEQILQTGNKYSFTILPNSDCVLMAEPSE